MRKHQSTADSPQSVLPELYFVISAGTKQIGLTEDEFVTAFGLAETSIARLLEMLRFMAMTCGEPVE